MKLRQAIKLLDKRIAYKIKKDYWLGSYAIIGSNGFIVWGNGDEEMRGNLLPFTPSSFLEDNWLAEINGEWIDDYKQAKEILQ